MRKWKEKFFSKEEISLGDAINKLCARYSFGVPSKNHPEDYKPKWSKEEEFYFNGNDDDAIEVSYYFAVRELLKKDKIIIVGGKK